MKTLLTIIVSVVLSLGGTYLLLTKAPLSWFPESVKHLFGTTAITNILGSDTISGSRTTINNNFSSLNANKAEISAVSGTTTLSSLANVGTILTGVWNATAIAVGFGGTGTTSPTSNLVMLGNGASGFKTVNGFGTSGQFLTSGGAGIAPTWASATVDQTQNYTWTGKHFFTSDFVVNNSTASSTIVGNLNVGTITASTTPLAILYQNNLENYSVTSSATSSGVTVVIPANSFGQVNKSLRITETVMPGQTGSSNCVADIEFGNGSATSSIGYTLDAGGGRFINMQTNLYATSTTWQYATSQGFTIDNGNTTNVSYRYIGTNVNLANQSYIAFATKSTAASPLSCTILSATVEKLTF